MSDNIIEFPTVNKAENDNKSLDATHNIIEDMQKQKVSDMSNYLAESILMAGAKEMVANGVDVSNPEFL